MRRCERAKQSEHRPNAFQPIGCQRCTSPLFGLSSTPPMLATLTTSAWAISVNANEAYKWGIALNGLRGKCRTLKRLTHHSLFGMIIMPLSPLSQMFRLPSLTDARTRFDLNRSKSFGVCTSPERSACFLTFNQNLNEYFWQLLFELINWTGKGFSHLIWYESSRVGAHWHLHHDMTADSGCRIQELWHFVLELVVCLENWGDTEQAEWLREIGWGLLILIDYID